MSEVISIVEGTLITANADPDKDISCACAADLMSDVLAHARSGAVLLTGLTNPQVVRTVEMAEIVAIVFTLGKRPPLETIALAEEKDIPLVTSKYTMFEVCSRLFQAGMGSCNMSR